MTATTGHSPRLGARELNRATLARQLLLHRESRPALEVVEHLVGLQAQAPFPPYYGLLSRIDGFAPGELAAALQDRSVVRIVLMRGTVHLVSAADCALLYPWLRPLLVRSMRVNPGFRAALDGLDHAELARRARAVLAEQQCTWGELGAELARHWPQREPGGLAHGARALLPLVQVPPRAVWGRTGQPRFATAESWLDIEFPAEGDARRIVRRYVAAFGPASVADAQQWSGLTRLGEVFDALRPSLRTFTDEHGRELFDLPEAPRPAADTPAPVRLLAGFDNLLLSHADRSRVIDDADLKRSITVNGQVIGGVLVDGRVRGAWRIERAKGTAAVCVTPYRKLSKKAAAGITREARRVLAFADPDATHDVRIDEP